eukprot:CAMPEP_0203887382 /NCGR_PEP_ID=MMETSP0359-20131031/31093_1 /ASSEMBLY_ACC=CAM_ASM_000338 /TAXON_ID=268821 /ORGANISM="Scrippsiella Hangoei, Strain SHTV-5" /LENGTH=252 /DNA_ID=CAMNT_0050808381 /DNA_START=24 /DNA_END=779 /DNA_ORIENTATION=-
MGLAPDVSSFRIALVACQKPALWQRSLAMVSEMKDHLFLVDVQTLKVALNTCQAAGQQRYAEALRQEINSMLGHAFPKSASREDEEWVWNEWRSKRDTAPTTSQNTYLTRLDVLKDAEVDPKLLMNTVMHLIKRNALVNSEDYWAVLKAFEKRGLWRSAINLFDQMFARQLSPTMGTFAAVQNMCLHCQLWAQALHVLQRCRDVSHIPRVSYINVIIRTLDQCQQWQRALFLLERMGDWAVPPSEFTFRHMM